MSRYLNLIKQADIPLEDYLKVAPAIPKKRLESMNKEFTPYIFYARKADGSREYTCTSCRRTYDEKRRTLSNEDFYLSAASEGELVQCPFCKAQAILKASGRGKKKLYEEIFCDFILKANKNLVVIRGVRLRKDYEKHGVNPPIECDTVADTVLQPGKWQQLRVKWLYGRCGWYEAMYHPAAENENIRTIDKIPAIPYGWYCKERKHFTDGWDVLDGTFLKYAVRDKANVVEWLGAQARYPIIEKLEKAGYISITHDYVLRRKKCGRKFNWDADSIKDFFCNYNSTEYKQFEKLTRKSRMSLLEILDFYEKCDRKIELDAIVSMFDKISVDMTRLKRALKTAGTDFCSLFKYVEKSRSCCHAAYAPHTSQIVQLWVDYIEMAKELDYDFSVFRVVFPRQLTEAHDAADANRHVKADNDEGYSKRKKKLEKMYSFEKDGFAIVVPEGSADILREGRLMEHCVGGYAAMHIKGSTTILFLRATENIDCPLYTIEIDDTSLRIRQIQGFNNRTPLTPEASAFYEEWQHEIFERRNNKKNRRKSA